jgi:hypothetical protein
MKNFLNLDFKTITIIILIIVVIFGGGFFWNKNSKLQQQYNLEVNLKNALQDSIEYYQNKEGEWVAEKLTLQADLKDLEDENLNLSENQKRLVARLKTEQKEKDIIAAALAQQQVVIDSLLQAATNVDTVNNTIDFVKVTDTLEYDIQILEAKPIENGNPQMLIKKLRIPNELFVEFHWEDEKTHPIAVSVTNSNPMFKTNDLDSYAIPELQKEEINPTGWQKFKKFLKKNGEKVLVFLGGAAVGGLVVMGSQ